jgi:hypothetical protein
LIPSVRTLVSHGTVVTPDDITRVAAEAYEIVEEEEMSSIVPTTKESRLASMLNGRRRRYE